MYSFLENKNEDFPNYKVWGLLHLMSKLPDFTKVSFFLIASWKSFLFYFHLSQIVMIII